MRPRTQKTLWLAGMGATLIATAVAARVLAQENRAARQVARYFQHPSEPDSISKTLVVYYSRSGYTKLMAQEIARRHPGKLVELVDETYKPGPIGYAKAALYARKKEANITPATLDVSAFDTVYIGSPIWLSTPAPPVWAFARNTDFAGRNVILFTTLNSRFDEKYITEFAQLIRQRGGNFIRHLSVPRKGKSTDEFLTDVKTLVH